MIAQALQSEDIAWLMRLEEEIFPDPWSRAAWETSFARADFFGYALKEGETPVGFVCGTSLFEEGELLKIAVRQTERGQGYGKTLLAALLQEAKKRGAERVFLEVREGNTPARKLYEGNGFIPTRVRKNYYADGENAVEMCKIL